MGQCYGKNIPVVVEDDITSRTGDRPQTPPTSTPFNGAVSVPSVKHSSAHSSSNSPWPSPFPHGTASSPLPPGISASPARSTPRRFFRRPFPPPSPAKHIKASLVKRFGHSKPKEGPIPEDGTEVERSLDKNFEYSKNFETKYELGKEVGRGHFGHTCSAKGKKGEAKGHLVAVKIISKAKDRSPILLQEQF